MGPYLDIIRPQNLFIVALTQLAFQYYIIDPCFKNSGIFWTLSPLLFSVLMAVTILIAAGGYVINDIYDTSSDKINKSLSKQIVGNKISLNEAWAYYFRILLIGALLAFLVAKSIDEITLFFIYPAAVSLLFLYSRYFKNLPVIGNIVISTFTGIVLFILLFAEREGLATLAERNESVFQLLRYFSLFIIVLAFLSNWVREIIKDIEDLEGDQKVGAKTMVVLLGTPTSKIILLIIEMIICLVLFYWFRLMSDWMTGFHFYYFIIGLVIPIIMILFLSLTANKKQDYSRLSGILKVYMALGVAYLVFFPI